MNDSLKKDNPLVVPIAFADTHVRQKAREKAQRTAAYDALVLDAKLRQSLVTLRSLGRYNKNVAALEVENLLEQSRHVPAFSSRWCQQAYVAPPYVQRTDDFLAYLKNFLDHTGARVLITSADGTLAVLREHRQEIEQCGTRIALAAEPALSVALNKERTLKLASHLGLGVPRGILLTSVEDVACAVNEIGLPAVVKPVETWRWEQQQGKRLVCRLVATADEARMAIEELTCSGGTVLFQQFLSGGREAVSFLYANGKMRARFAQWAKRTHPQLGGTSVYRQSIALPDDISSQAELLVREIGLEGYSEVEFRRDHRGKPYLMEINPRLSASVEIAVRAGVDFPYLLYQWAAGEPVASVDSYRVGGWMRYLEGDLLTTIQACVERGRPGVTPAGKAIGEFLGAFFIPAGYDYLDWHDLRPAASALSEFCDRVWQKVGKMVGKEKN